MRKVSLFFWELGVDLFSIIVMVIGAVILLVVPIVGIVLVLNYVCEYFGIDYDAILFPIFVIGGLGWWFSNAWKRAKKRSD